MTEGGRDREGEGVRGELTCIFMYVCDCQLCV